MKWTRKRLYLIGTFLLAGLGFSSCSKPDDDPFNNDWYDHTTIPGVYAYGTMPVSFHDNASEVSGPILNSTENLPAELR